MTDNQFFTPKGKEGGELEHTFTDKDGRRYRVRKRVIGNINKPPQKGPISLDPNAVQTILGSQRQPMDLRGLSPEQIMRISQSNNISGQKAQMLQYMMGQAAKERAFQAVREEEAYNRFKDQRSFDTDRKDEMFSRLMELGRLGVSRGNLDVSRGNLAVSRRNQALQEALKNPVIRQRLLEEAIREDALTDQSRLQSYGDYLTHYKPPEEGLDSGSGKGKKELSTEDLVRIEKAKIRAFLPTFINEYGEEIEVPIAERKEAVETYNNAISDDYENMLYYDPRSMDVKEVRLTGRAPSGEGMTPGWIRKQVRASQAANEKDPSRPVLTTQEILRRLVSNGKAEVIPRTEIPKKSGIKDWAADTGRDIFEALMGVRR